MTQKQIKPVLTQLAEKGFRYWASVVVIGALGIYANLWLGRHTPDRLQDLRMEVFEKINNQGGRTPSPVNITLVQIGDDEYWKGSLARRVPVKRDYLAALVNKLCAADPQVVALDFDLHSPVVDGSYNDNPEYKSETLTLVNSVNRAATSGCKVVLPVAMDCASNNSCVREAGVLDGYRFTSSNITWGYITLPKDIRQVPLRRPYAAGGQLVSFMQAIVRAVDARKAETLTTQGSLPYSTFIPFKQYERDCPTVKASEVLTLSREALETKIKAHIVVVGANWHATAWRRGPLIDEHLSPLGPVSGAFLHVNYAAAVLDNRTGSKASEWQFQHPGYSYNNPGSYKFTLTSQPMTLRYEIETRWNVPCDGHAVGTEHATYTLQRVRGQ